MKRINKIFALGITIILTSTVLMGCGGNTKTVNSAEEASVNASVDANVNATIEATSEAASAATTQANEAKEISNEASTTETSTANSSEGVSFEKVDGGSNSENAIDSATVDVSLGDHYDDPPVTDLPDPTISDK